MGIIHTLKRTVRRFFWLFGLDMVKRQENYTWLKEFKIKVILDIGANKGDYSVKFRKIFPFAQIYAFEPIKHVFHELNYNLRKDKRFKSFNLALGEKKSDMIISESVDGGNHTLLEMTSLVSRHSPNSEIVKRKERVSVERLDDISSKLQIQKEMLVKIDVQGYENMVIAGGMKTLSNAKVVILETSFVEFFKGQALFSEIYGTFKKMGFEYYGSFDQIYSKSDGRIIQQDAIFIRK